MSIKDRFFYINIRDYLALGTDDEVKLYMSRLVELFRKKLEKIEKRALHSITFSI